MSFLSTVMNVGETAGWFPGMQNIVKVTPVRRKKKKVTGMAIMLSSTALGACTTVASRVSQRFSSSSIHTQRTWGARSTGLLDGCCLTPPSQGDRRRDLCISSCVTECLWTVNTGKAENLCFNLFIWMNSINRSDCCSTGGPGSDKWGFSGDLFFFLS